jgi:hypothetical protein
VGNYIGFLAIYYLPVEGFPRLRSELRLNTSHEPIDDVVIVLAVPNAA